MADNVNHIRLEYEAKNLEKILGTSKNVVDYNEKLIGLVEELNKGLVDLDGKTSKWAQNLKSLYSGVLKQISGESRTLTTNASKFAMEQAKAIQSVAKETKKAMKDSLNQKEMESSIKNLEKLREEWQANERNIAKSRQSLLNGKKNTPIEEKFLIETQKRLQKEIDKTRAKIESLYRSYDGATSQGRSALEHDDNAKAFTESNIKQREARDLLMQYQKEYSKILAETEELTQKYGTQNEATKQSLEMLKEKAQLVQQQINLLEEEQAKLVANGQLTEEEGKDVLNRLNVLQQENENYNQLSIKKKQASEDEKQYIQLVKDRYDLEQKILKLSTDENGKITKLEQYKHKNEIAALQQQKSLTEKQIQQIKQKGTLEGNVVKKIEEEVAAEKQADLITQAHNRDLQSQTKFIGDTIKNFAKFTIYYQTLQKVTQGVQKAIETMKELDKAFTDIKLVTGGTAEETAQLADEYNALAKEIGATTVEVAEGAGEWLRQGKTAEETAQLLKASMTLSKVGAIESSQATQLLTSSLNGYKMEARDAMSVVDKISAIDLAAATSSEELATALARTANIADDSSVSFDKLLAMIGTVSSVTRRSAETIRRII